MRRVVRPFSQSMRGWWGSLLCLACESVLLSSMTQFMLGVSRIRVARLLCVVVGCTLAFWSRVLLARR